MWDDEINEAARALTSGSPGGEFKARVLARIERDAGGWSRRALAASTIAAAVLVAIAIYRGAPRSDIVPLKPDAAIVADTVRLKPEGTIAADTVELTPDTTILTDTVRPTPDLPIPQAAVEDSELIAVEPLTIASIEVAAIDSDQLTIDALIVPTLEIPALDDSTSNQ